MRYKVGEVVQVAVEILNGSKRLLGLRDPAEGSTLEIKDYPIVAINESQGTYKLILDDDVLGWVISKFHVRFEHVDEKYLGKNFYDVSESYITDIEEG
jgi:hypothetical protein